MRYAFFRFRGFLSDWKRRRIYVRKIGRLVVAISANLEVLDVLRARYEASGYTDELRRLWWHHVGKLEQNYTELKLRDVFLRELLNDYDAALGHTPPEFGDELIARSQEGKEIDWSDFARDTKKAEGVGDESSPPAYVPLPFISPRDDSKGSAPAYRPESFAHPAPQDQSKVLEMTRDGTHVYNSLRSPLDRPKKKDSKK